MSWRSVGRNRSNVVRSRAWRPSSPLTRGLEYLFVLVVVVFCIGPLYAMVVASFARVDQLGSTLYIPLRPTLENYRIAWTDLGFARMFVNSSILSLSSSVLATMLAAVAAFGLVRFRFLGQYVTIALLVVALAVPPIVVLVPIFDMMSKLGLVSQYASGIVTEMAFLLPFSTVVIYSYMRDLPEEPFEAATVDGAGAVRQFWNLAVPMSRSALVTAFVISMVFVWNDLLVPLYLWPTSDLQTLMTGLATLGPGRTGLRNVPLLMSGVMISTVPLIVLFIAARGTLVRGLTEGGSK